jgi:hypothetical protein
MTHPIHRIVAILCAFSMIPTVMAQTEANGWGSLRGIRLDGELIPFTTSLKAARPDWKEIAQTASEQVRRPHFIRAGNKQTFTGGLAFKDEKTIAFTQTVEDVAPGTAKIDVHLTADADVDLAGVYFFVELPLQDFADAKQDLQDNSGASARGIRLATPTRQLEISLDSAAKIVSQTDKNAGHLQIYFPIVSGNLSKGQTASASFTIRLSGDVDKTPAMLKLDAQHPGRTFDGIGGNFRLQNPQFDSPIIQYNLEHLRVAWGRVAMPLDRWQHEENVDPRTIALDPGVRAAMEMAQRLSQRNILVIVSAWRAPAWALDAPASEPVNGKIPRGRAVKPEKLDALCKSIASYLEYLKKNYDVDAQFFSFNESDLGIDVRQTGEEHAQLIKHLGAEMAARGLATKMLLGDTSDATPVDFIQPAMNDPQAIKYIGAVSFHSWRGGRDDQLTPWSQAATKLKVPLLVAEGGTDAGAWGYPAIFREPWFAIDEINLYVRICALCQPRSIIEWQLTSDYSILAGGRDGQPLAPTMRFWQLKQLGLTPAGSAWLAISTDQSAISCCAFGDANTCIVHVVNNAATRALTISGFPTDLKSASVYVTDSKRGMAESAPLSIKNGTATLTVDSLSFMTLIAHR